MNAHKILTTVVLASLICGCEEHKKPVATKVRAKPTSFSESDFLSLTPTLDGAIYALDFEGRLWYVKDGNAFQVRAPEGALPDFDDIIPSTDGSAYASSFGGGLWHLSADSAKRVTADRRAASSVPAAIPNGAAAFALYVSERKKRLNAEARAEEAESR